MNLNKSDLFIKAYQSKEHQRKEGERSKFVYLCSQLGLDPVYEKGSWKAYITKDIYIRMASEGTFILFDSVNRVWDCKLAFPEWVVNCSECKRHVPAGRPYAQIKLNSDLGILLEQVGEYLEGAPKDTPVPDETHFRWIAKQHNGHLTLREMVFGPVHKYYDLYPGIIRGLWYKFIGRPV